MVEIIIHDIPEVTEDWSEEFEAIAMRKREDVIDAMADGGKPPWERTKHGAIPRLHDRFSDQVDIDFGSQYAKVLVGGSPDTFLHHFGGDVFQVVTAKQRGFFWSQFYETDDETWKYMALSKTLLSSHPPRPLADWYDEDEEWIGEILGEGLFKLDQTKGTHNTWTQGHA